MDTISKQIGWALASYFVLRPIFIATGWDDFLKNKWMGYSNMYYKAAAKNNTNRASVIILIFILIIVFISSEVAFLNIWNPPSTLLDKTLGKAMDQYPVQTDRWVMGLLFLFNVGLIEFVIRIESVYSITTRFNQMLRIIRPDIGEIEYRSLNKEWALMNSKSDYKKILNELFTNNKILIDNKEKFPDEVKIFNKIPKEKDDKQKNISS
jgi:hypothetical protein